MNNPAENPAAHSASCVLSSTANELQDLAKKTADIQTLVGTLLPQLPKGVGADLYKLQNIDYITQSLEGLADFLDHLASDTPKEWVYPHLAAADVVKLEALAARLSGDSDKISRTTPDDDGDLDLF